MAKKKRKKRREEEDILDDDDDGDESRNLVIKTSKSNSGFLLPEKVYKVKVSSIMKVDGKFGPQLQWDFEILTKKHKGKRVRDWTPIQASPDNKTGKYIRNIGGRRIKKDGTFKIGKLIGRQCKILLSHKESPTRGKVNKVESVLSLDLEDSD